MEGRWSDGQIELFHALGKICARIGKDGADGMYCILAFRIYFDFTFVKLSFVSVGD